MKKELVLETSFNPAKNTLTLFSITDSNPEDLENSKMITAPLVCLDADNALFLATRILKYFRYNLVAIK